MKTEVTLTLHSVCFKPLSSSLHINICIS